jgi:precorrin-3B C17-methyltransferase
MAFYNPRSKTRPEGFERTLDILRACCEPERVIIFARAVSTPEQALNVTTIARATPEMADMRTVVIVGSSLTRVIERTGAKDGAPIVYTPRSVLDGTVPG